MNELILHDYGFKLIPKMGENMFIDNVSNWYHYANIDEDIALIEPSMIWDDRGAAYSMIDFYYEVRSYLFATKKNPGEFPVDVFPVDDQRFVESGLEAEQECVDLLYAMEKNYYEDMKRYLNANKMFYSDRYADVILWHQLPKIKYINQPISEVW